MSPLFRRSAIERFTTIFFAALFAAASGAAGQTAPVPAEQDRTRARDLVFETPGGRTVPMPAVPRGYALVVGGGGEYRHLDESMQLLFAQSDAEAMYPVLISHEGGAFPPENVLFTGAQATLANVRQAVEEWFPSVAGPNRVVVYFAGHGFVQNGRGYLAPADVDPRRLEDTAYPMSALGDVMANRVRAHWKVLLTDACHSGKINAETTNEALDLQFGNLPRSFLTLTATREREMSHEDPDLSTGFGFFTYFLTQAWRGHADNDPCDGRITADEVIEYVRANVRRYARDRQLSQTPTARGDYDPAMLLGVGTVCLGTADPAASVAAGDGDRRGQHGSGALARAGTRAAAPRRRGCRGDAYARPLRRPRGGPAPSSRRIRRASGVRGAVSRASRSLRRPGCSSSRRTSLRPTGRACRRSS